jgi:hypothetical protein
MKLPRSLAYELPMLSFIAIRTPSGGFVATCLQLCLDGYGTTEDSAIDDMVEYAESFLESTSNGRLSPAEAWENLASLACIDEQMAKYWNAYRRVQLDLASRGVAIFVEGSWRFLV